MAYAPSYPLLDLTVSRREMPGANVEGIIGVGGQYRSKRMKVDRGRRTKLRYQKRRESKKPNESDDRRVGKAPICARAVFKGY